ncbi:MAG: bifunctional glutamate N-acetyltransferase/amino-acid acetyltransferase ArgJ [Deltaproteobacteria bacterium]|nr:bifunctional glutamate N-acetyltransferase/amino-acid acetyltransferase ArgJ [Deltaproteobacteria bacterium]MBW2305451.1 bifunctional glutamate N-acetyltransferase/amino-acid acetyltransferase ArgJ [Deltaproteobacteria bacterium]
MTVSGFRASSGAAGVKAPGKASRDDMALVAADSPAVAAAVFTRNIVQAAPVRVAAENLKSGRCQALLMNSGNANACTGEQGIQDARELCREVAERLGCPETLVVPASTGVIGTPLPVQRMRPIIPTLAARLRPDGFSSAARAIMTTDTFPKLSVRRGSFGKREVTVLGFAKGAGMIMPNMATMLCAIITDAAVTQDALALALRQAVDQSFHRLTVDGDTSTNDMVLAMASGAAGNKPITRYDPEVAQCAELLLGCTLELARMIARDGEGATKFVEVIVRGAPTRESARAMARKIANSPLVKTAFYGHDANWGRIICAAGTSGVQFDPERFDLRFDDVLLVSNGVRVSDEAEEQAHEVLKHSAFTVTLDLKAGPAQDSVFTCDLSADYVRINAEYRT